MERVKDSLNKMNMKIHTKELESPCKTCSECGDEIETIVKWFDGSYKKVPIKCQCIKNKEELDRKKEEKIKRERKLESLYKYSMMNESKRTIRFSNSKINNEDRAIFELAYKYCNNWSEMKKDGIGFLFYGGVGVGKTHLSYCIANELIDRGVSVVIISTINLINRIYSSYGKYGEDGEMEIINSLNAADLLILDDLGAEHGTPKAKQIIYSILDTRASNDLSTITTTNLKPEQLKEKISQDDNVPRTYDRLIEMCYPIEFKGVSKRLDKLKKKEQIIKEKLF